MEREFGKSAEGILNHISVIEMKQTNPFEFGYVSGSQMTMIMKKTKMMLALGALLGALGCNDDVIQDLSSPTGTTKEKEVAQAFLAKKRPSGTAFYCGQ